STRAHALTYLGLVRRGQGLHAEAAALLKEGLLLRRELGEKVQIIDSLEAPAGLHPSGGDAPRGARFLGVAGAPRGQNGRPTAPPPTPAAPTWRPRPPQAQGPPPFAPGLANRDAPCPSNRRWTMPSQT